MQVEDDGKGWVWLAAEMSPGGLAVELFKSVPYGKRAILVAKQSNVDELFQKVGMSVAFDAVASRGYKGWLEFEGCSPDPFVCIMFDCNFENCLQWTHLI